MVFIMKIHITILFFVINSILLAKELPFVILIPSYNNASYVEKNLKSCLSQNYANYRIIYINDMSTDNTLDEVQKIIEEDNGYRVELINNKRRKLALQNIYDTVSNLVSDDEIVVLVDGDDSLAGPDVLSYLNKTYLSNDILMTYGQFEIHTSQGSYQGSCLDVPKTIIQRNTYRRVKSTLFNFSHVRTFYAWLFKKINRNHLLDPHGQFFRSAWDLAIMYPMLEMANGRFKFINKVLYHYNAENPISDCKIRRQEQYNFANYIQRQKPYRGLSNSELPKFFFERN